MYIAFKYFLEKGYESTSIRDICKDVDIKPSSLYFYYKSKQELFFNIYDEIWNEKIKYIQCIDELKQDISPKLKLHSYYKSVLGHYTKDIVKQKFLLRYHLFAPEEVSIDIRERYKCWKDEDNKIILDIIDECIDAKLLSSNIPANSYLQRYKRFETYQVTEMIISNIKISNEELDITWSEFWDSIC
jgi:AcrR family transcriptional regulator